MATKSEPLNSLVDQILKDTFAKVQHHTEFSEQLQKELKQLAANGELKKASRVIELLKTPIKEPS